MPNPSHRHPRQSLPTVSFDTSPSLQAGVPAFHYTTHIHFHWSLPLQTQGFIFLPLQEAAAVCWHCKLLVPILLSRPNTLIPSHLSSWVLLFRSLLAFFIFFTSSLRCSASCRLYYFSNAKAPGDPITGHKVPPSGSMCLLLLGQDDAAEAMYDPPWPHNTFQWRSFNHPWVFCTANPLTRDKCKPTLKPFGGNDGPSKVIFWFCPKLLENQITFSPQVLVISPSLVLLVESEPAFYQMHQ